MSISQRIDRKMTGYFGSHPAKHGSKLVLYISIIILYVSDYVIETSS